jgi:ribosome-associated heat shock protein Hsp15
MRIPPDIDPGCSPDSHHLIPADYCGRRRNVSSHLNRYNFMDKVRIDKWLWAVRIFKSRTLAGDTVRQGKVRLNGTPAKPSTRVAVGDRLQVSKNGFNLEFEILRLLQKRVGAPIAVTCYVNHTPEAEMNKYKDWFIGRRGSEFRKKGAGRPTKRERREIDSFKEDFFAEFDEYDE